MEVLLTERDVAEKLKVSVRTVEHYRKREINPIPFIKLGGAIRFQWLDVEEWIERQKVQRGA